MILLKQSHNNIHHRNVSLLSQTNKNPGCVSSGALSLSELKDFGGELQNQKEGEIKRKTVGKGTEREVILPFSASRGGLFIQGLKEGLLQWRGPTGAVCGGGAALSRPLSGLIALEYSSLRAGSDHGLLEGLAPAPPQPHSAKEPRHNAHN